MSTTKWSPKTRGPRYGSRLRPSSSTAGNCVPSQYSSSCSVAKCRYSSMGKCALDVAWALNTRVPPPTMGNAAYASSSMTKQMPGCGSWALPRNTLALLMCDAAMRSSVSANLRSAPWSSLASMASKGCNGRSRQRTLAKLTRTPVSVSREGGPSICCSAGACASSSSIGSISFASCSANEQQHSAVD